MAKPTERVLAHLHERGKIATAMVQDIIGAHRKPSEMLNYLRRRGHVIETDLPRYATEWIYRGREGERHGLETHKLPCIRCGAVIHAETWPGEKPTKWRKYTKCLELKDDTAKGGRYSKNEERRKITQNSRTVKQCTHDQGTVYRPGDEGFEERAREVTHIKDIKTRATDLALSVRIFFKY